MALRPPTYGATKALQVELKRMNDEPVEGFTVRLPNDDNLFEWEVAIFGPPGTLYEGGYFKALMKFPPDYPYSPPTVRFLTRMWHPNVYENGDVCISILHPPVDDPQSGELPSERWNPTQNVRTILLSVISLLNEPNTFSPANVDASVMYRKWKESAGKEKEYENIIRTARWDQGSVEWAVRKAGVTASQFCMQGNKFYGTGRATSLKYRKQVSATKDDAVRDGVNVPMTLEEYCVRARPSEDAHLCGNAGGDADFYNDDFLEDDDCTAGDFGCDYGSGDENYEDDDSGNGDDDES